MFPNKYDLQLLTGILKVSRLNYVIITDEK